MIFEFKTTSCFKWLKSNFAKCKLFFHIKLLFYSRNTYMADSLLGVCVLNLGARPEFSLGAPRPLVEKSWLSLEPEKRPTGPEDFLYRHRTALGSVEVSAYAYRAP